MRYMLLAVCLIAVAFGFRTQSVAVKGKLRCGQEPANDILVKLIDQDAGYGPDPNDFIAQTNTNAAGEFTLSGSTEEISIIDPEIRIYHECNARGRKCQRKWKIRVPSKYIADGPEPTMTMDLGDLNLEVELEKESKDCS